VENLGQPCPGVEMVGIALPRKRLVGSQILDGSNGLNSGKRWGVTRDFGRISSSIFSWIRYSILVRLAVSNDGASKCWYM